MEKYYLCIDLKTFFASVECVERGLDPFKTDLVVADQARSKGTICLAISPKMKARGIRNRCRMYEIPKYVKPIIAKPRMKKYIEYSTRIYGIYLKYFSKEDIHIYSIDEVFIDITNYLKMYQKNPKEIAFMVTKDIYDTTGITATAGVGTNLYLAKVAMDIISKHSKDNFGYLDIERYQRLLWHHTPLTDFWQVGEKTVDRLHKLHLKDMYDISICDEKILYKEFGVNAKYLIDHSKGIEPTTIKQIKEYKPKSSSISNSQILPKDYDYLNAKKVLTEMVDNIVLRLVSKNQVAKVVGIYIGYSHDLIEPLKFSKKITPTNSYQTILKIVLDEYNYRINEDVPIRKIGIYLGNIEERKYEQLDLFSNYKNEEKDLKVEQVINKIKSKFGKNAILRGISYTEDATGRKRNEMIGGHNG